jgi:hypothetical protein
MVKIGMFNVSGDFEKAESNWYEYLDALIQQTIIRQRSWHFSLRGLRACKKLSLVNDWVRYKTCTFGSVGAFGG